MKRWMKAAGVGLLAASMLLTGCGKEEGQQKQEGRLKIITTFYPMYEFTKQVAGDNADVQVLVPAGTEPHDWEPTPKDVAQIADADLFVYNGAGFESWVDSVLESVNSSTLQVVEASKGADMMEGEEDEHGHGDEHADEHGEAKEGEHKEGEEEHVLDPHIWLDPVLAQHEVQVIADALSKADAANAAEYKQNAEAYIAKLQALDEKFKSGLSNLNKHEFVTNHTAFAYLAKRYNLEQVPISGISPEQEPTAAQLTEIVEFAKEHDVKTIFFETLASPKVAETVAKEVGADTAVLNPLEGLTDEEKAQGLDYIGVMEQNLAALQQALSK